MIVVDNRLNLAGTPEQTCDYLRGRAQRWSRYEVKIDRGAAPSTTGTTGRTGSAIPVTWLTSTGAR